MTRRSTDSIALALVAVLGLLALGAALMAALASARESALESKPGSKRVSDDDLADASTDESAILSPDDSADAQLRHVETYLRIAREEVDCRDAFERARRHLARAERAAERAGEQQSDPRLRTKWQHQITELALRIAAGEQSASRYFYGAFPWATCLVSSTMPRDSTVGRQVELFDDPAAIAVRTAIARQIAAMEASDHEQPQVDFLVFGDPPDAQLEFEAATVYAGHDLFRPYDTRRLSEARLSKGDWSTIRQLAPSSGTIAKLVGGASSGRVMLTRITPIDQIDGRHRYEVTARVYVDGESTAAMTMSFTGTCRDRRSAVPLIVGWHAWSLAFVVALGVWLNSRRDDVLHAAGWSAAPWLVGAFVCGRALVWPVAKVLTGTMPDGRASAVAGGAWTVAAGAAIALGPALLTWALARRLRLLESLQSTVRPSLLLIASVAGASAYLGQHALILRDWIGVSMAIPVWMSALVASYPLVRLLEDDGRSSERWRWPAAFAALAIAAIGPSFALGRAWPSWLIAGMTAGVLTASAAFESRSCARRRTRRGGRDAVGSATDGAAYAGSNVPTTIDGLLRGTIDPPYQPTPTAAALLQELKALAAGKTVSCALSGRAGVGKSATIRAVEAALQHELPDVAILQGACPQPQHEGAAEPYLPFVEAIERHFRIHPLASKQRQIARVQDTLGGIFAETIPFAGLLFPPDEPEPAIDKQHVFQSVADMLRNLAARQPVLVVIDDVHWIDAGSRELAEFLVRAFPVGANVPIGLLFAGREDHPLFSRLNRLTIPPPDPSIQRAILVRGLGLAGNVAESLIQALGNHRDALPGLLQIVAHFARQGHLEWRDEGFAWKAADFRLEDHLPDDFRQTLEAELTVRPDLRYALECAACIGPQFTVEQLSAGLELSRWQTLQLLDELERTTNLIRDVRSRDDEFEFCSSFLLEALRKMFDVSAAGPATSSAPQRIREFHYRLGCAAERSLESSNAQLYAAANHFYAAGARHATRAYRLALRAAQTASAQFRSDLARRYVEMATACAAFCGGDDRELRDTLLLVECQAAHVEGTGRVEAASRASAYLTEHPESDFVVYQAAVRALYDAGVDTHDQAHFRAAAEMARRMAERFTDPLHQAEALQFRGIALPRAESAARRQYLETALALIESVEHAESIEHAQPDGRAEAESSAARRARLADALRLKSRIVNSLAEQLSYGTAEDKLEAQRLFRLSIELKSRRETYDAHGLALAHGGLGRLALFAERPDLAAAREHFLADLEYSRQVGSRTGQTRMHGLLAAVELKECGSLSDQSVQQDLGGEDRARVERALAHFREALELADERWDKTIALAGLVQCHGALGQFDAARWYGPPLADLVQGAAPGVETMGIAAARSADAMPPHCRRAIASALRQCDACRNEAWHHVLGEIK